MPARFWVLRIVIGLMCTVFAYLLGQSIVGDRKPAKRGAGKMAWAVRTVVAGAALLWGTGLDALAMGFYVLAILSGVLGFLRQRRPKRQEDVDLVKEMFPKE